MHIQTSMTPCLMSPTLQATHPRPEINLTQINPVCHAPKSNASSNFWPPCHGQMPVQPPKPILTPLSHPGLLYQPTSFATTSTRTPSSGRHDHHLVAIRRTEILTNNAADQLPFQNFLQLLTRMKFKNRLKKKKVFLSTLNTETEKVKYSGAS